jgi:pilus assembly protein FimV
VQTKIFLVFFAIFFYHNGFTAQLGKIDVKSNQGSPFNAEINLTLDKGDDLKKMKASIAPQKIYDSQGMKRQAIHSDIKINLNNIGENNALVTLKSSNPIKESFVDLLIQIDSPKGKVLKEYTVLLDPPLPQSKELSNKLAEKNDNTSTNNNKSSKKVTTQKRKKTLTTRSGKTLFQIARENSIAGITTEQFAVAIFQLNPKAFAKNNINGLNKGQKIVLPDDEYFKSLSHLKARKILREQNLQWNKKRSEKKQNKTKTSDKKVVSEANQDEIKKLNAEINRLKDALKKQKAMTEQIKISKKEDNSAKKEVLKEVKPEVKSTIEKKEKALNQKDDELIEIEEQDFVSSVAIEDEVLIEEVYIEDEDQSQNKSRSGLIYFLLILFAILGGLLVFLSKKRAKLRTITDEIQPRTSVEEYILRKKNEQGFNRN